MHAEKAVSAEEEPELQVLMESVGRKSSRLQLERAVNRGGSAEKWRLPGASGSNERQGRNRRMKEDEGREQKRMVVVVVMMMTMMIRMRMRMAIMGMFWR